ncbi:unnamed protein product, partial [Rotaria sp. Silwood1]
YVNEPAAMQNASLHISLSNSVTCDEIIVQDLCDVDAHLDYVINWRETDIDAASDRGTN